MDRNILDAEYSNTSEKPKRNNRTLAMIAAFSVLAGLGAYFASNQTTSKPPEFPIEAAGGQKSDLPSPVFNEPMVAKDNVSSPSLAPDPVPVQNNPTNPPHSTPIPVAAPNTSSTASVPIDLEKRIQVLEKSMGALNEKIPVLVAELKKNETATQNMATEIKKLAVQATPAAAKAPANAQPTPAVVKDKAPDAPAAQPASLPTESISGKGYGITAIMKDGIIYSKDGEDREITIGEKVPGLLGKLVHTSPSGKLVITDKKIYRLN